MRLHESVLIQASRIRQESRRRAKTRFSTPSPRLRGCGQTAEGPRQRRRSSQAQTGRCRRPKTTSLAGTWTNTGGVQVKITDDGKSIRLQAGETPALVSLNGTLTRTKTDVFEGTVRVIARADRSRSSINVQAKATLVNPDELHITYAHWPTFNKKGIRQAEDTMGEDTIKRIPSE